MLLRLSPILGIAMVLGCASVSEPPIQVTPAPPETWSLLGTPLYAAPLSPEVRDTLEARLARARDAYDRDPENAEAILWLGRRTAYLGRFRAAVTIFSEGIAKHPEDARFYRHRGHRYLSLRLFDSAIADLERAAAMVEGKPDEVEPDGMPNARNTPTSTLHSNIWYHLGLAYYLTGDFAQARRAYQRCLPFSNNPDQLCATTSWLWQTLVRAGAPDSAAMVLEPIHAAMDLIENHDYHRLLLLYRGQVAPDTLLAGARRRGGTAAATVGYGVAGWWMARGDDDRAIDVMMEVVRDSAWAAFGHIAAEAELHRRGIQP